MLGYFLLFSVSALLTFLLLIPLLWLLRILNLSQNIRDEGPREHLKKKGTLTFGGTAFVVTILVLAVIFLDLEINVSIFALVLLMLAFAGIGFLDDFLKKVKGKNEGLYGRYKFLLQCVFAFLFVLFLFSQNPVQNLWYILFYFPFWIFILVGASNAANLTDGLDGLLAGTMGVAFATFAGIAFKLGQVEVGLFVIICSGATLGFLSYNMHPAKVFMGDVGSLPLGVLLAGIAILLKKEWWLAVVGGVLVIETLSVILQVLSFKLFKRRIFKMSPLHHHFELSGFAENQIVLIFWGASAILGLIAYWLI